MDAGRGPRAPGMVAMRRRTLFALGGAVAAGAAVPLSSCGRSGSTGELLTSSAPLPPPFSVPLPRPSVLTPTSTQGGVDRYHLEARGAEQEILPGLRTSLLTFGGTFPGPTIESRRGRPTVVEHVNKLPVPMVVHLHGAVAPASQDGFPTDLVLPEEPGRRAAHEHGAPVHDPQARVTVGRRLYRYPMGQRAATLWYHDHRMDFTGPMVYRGLAGFHLVRDDEEDALPLPRGKRELPLVIADRAFGSDGELLYPSLDPTLTTTPGVKGYAMEGVLGDVVLVNGAPWPQADVDAAQYRLRILNASNARRYRLRLDPPPPTGPAFVQVGSDGGLLASPVEHDSLTVAPAERFDVVVDFGAYPVGTKVTVRNDLGSGGTSVVLQFVVARRVRDDATVPAALSQLELLDADAAAITRKFLFTRGSVQSAQRPSGDGDDGSHRLWTINGRVFDPMRMDAVVRPGQVERWRFGTDLHHPVHVHLAPFQVASRGGQGPGPMDAGWKDTVDVRPAEHVDVLVRFPDLPGRYVMHCHNLEHEDMMMMSAFEVRA
jgi:spore coat protein A, manganese oxidase